MKFMNVGHAVKVTHEDSKHFNNIGVIEVQEFDYAVVNFGTHTGQLNINSLLDLTFQAYDHD